MKATKCYLEVVLFFRDGTKDWVSPVEDIDKDVFRDGSNVYVINPYYTYDYDISELTKVEVNKMVDAEVIESEVLYDFEYEMYI